MANNNSYFLSLPLRALPTCPSSESIENNEASVRIFPNNVLKSFTKPDIGSTHRTRGILRRFSATTMTKEDDGGCVGGDNARNKGRFVLRRGTAFVLVSDHLSSARVFHNSLNGRLWMAWRGVARRLGRTDGRTVGSGRERGPPTANLKTYDRYKISYNSRG